MKKRYLLGLIFLASTLGYSKTKPDIYLNTSVSYNIQKISHKEFENALLGSVVDGDYTAHQLVNSFGLDVLYPINLKQIDIKVGAGANFTVSSTHSKLEYVKYDKSTEIVDNVLQKLNKAKKERSQLDEKKSYLETVSTSEENKAKSYTKLTETMGEEKSSLNEKVDDLNSKKTDLEQEKTKLEEYLTQLNQKIQELKSEKETEEAKDSKDIDKIAELNSKIAHTEEEVSPTQEKITSKEAEITSVTNEISTTEAKVEELRTKIAEYEELSSASYAKSEAADNDKINLFQEIAKNLEEINRLEPEYLSELEKFYKSVTGEDYPLKERPEATDLEASLEYITYLETRKAELEKFLKDYKIAKNNKEAREMAEKHFNSEVNLGMDIYSVVEFGKNFNKDLSVFGTTKLGLSVKENTVYKLGKKLQEAKVEVDNSNYILPESVKSTRLLPLVEVGVGVYYKGFKAVLHTGYGTSVVGLNLGYEF